MNIYKFPIRIILSIFMLFVSKSSLAQSIYNQAWSVDNSSNTISECTSSNSDPDGDGWGWENNKSCKVVSDSGNLPSKPAAEPQLEPATNESSTEIPQLICPASVIDDANFLVKWNDDNPPALRNYDIWINGIDTGPSVRNVTSTQVNISPYTSGLSGNLEIELKYFDDGDVSNISTAKNCSVSYSFLDSNSNQLRPTAEPVLESAIAESSDEIEYITTNQEKLLKAKNLEQFFFDNFETFKKNTNASYKSSSEDAADKKWTAGTYGGLTGVRLYHFYDEFFALGRMIRLSSVLSPNHTPEYVDMAVEYIDEFVPKLKNGHGTKYCGNTSSRYKCDANPPQHRFLDASRGMAWLGYLMDSVLVVEPKYKDKFIQYANDLRPTLDRHISQVYKGPGANHMASHVALAADLLGRVGDYRNDYNEEIKTAINDIFIETIEKTDWVSSDLDHAEMSVNYLHYVYEQQKRGNIIPGQELITLNHMNNIAKTFFRMFAKDKETYTATLVRQMALLSPGSQTMADKLVETSRYTVTAPTGSHNVTYTLSTVASYAYAFAID